MWFSKIKKQKLSDEGSDSDFQDVRTDFNGRKAFSIIKFRVGRSQYVVC